MKAILVHLLLACIFVGVFSGVPWLVEENGEDEDSEEEEPPNKELRISQIGIYLDLLRRQEEYSDGLGSQIKKETKLLRPTVEELEDKVIDDIDKMKLSEKCKELAMKFVEVEGLKCEYKNQECLWNAVNAVKHPRQRNIIEIYDQIRHHGANDLGIDVPRLTKEIYEYGNSTQMAIIKLISDAAIDSSNCIHKNFEAFNSLRSKLNIMVNRCSEDNESITTDLMTFYSQFSEIFKMIDDMLQARDDFMTHRQHARTARWQRMNNKIDEYKSTLENLQRDRDCMQVVVDDLYITRFGYWLLIKECERQTVKIVLKNPYEMIEQPAGKRVQEYTSLPIDEISEFITRVTNYGNYLHDQVKVPFLVNEEMVLNINKFQVLAETWKKGLIRFNDYCFGKKWKNFERMSYYVFALASNCSRRVP